MFAESDLEENNGAKLGKVRRYQDKASYYCNIDKYDAISIIKNIQSGKSGNDHDIFPDSLKGNLAKKCWYNDFFSYGFEYGQIALLMNIFNIREEDLK